MLLSLFGIDSIAFFKEKINTFIKNLSLEQQKNAAIAALILKLTQFYFVPNSLSPASPKPGRMYPCSLSCRSSVET